ncbi:MAG TPA: gamma-glutamyl-gamma-aminobutyrate hydrolase family protein [Ferruginibacter sp.]|nr:gamma-glutamyl-gamma-aminobutyrate hydrolase family protein [Ferruginibacter sp.]HMP21801.1 gamma-glutamyl-gamma-aminobutyrate hydrolase family protein [Ferruginibacter sp.]
METTLKIGLTYTGSEEKHQNYVQWLKGNDAVEIIKLAVDENNATLVQELDAVVFSGGVDAHPKNYGSNHTGYPNAPANFNIARDDFEIELFQQCMQRQIPVLGICRGMQLINCILGGNLTQDLGEANSIHRNEGADKLHKVKIKEGTLLQQCVQVQEGKINSAHHQCVQQLGKGLQANAVSADGIIEGYEWKEKAGKPFLLCVQWHPERMYTMQLETSPLSKNIRDYFIQEVQQSKAAKA